MRPSPEEQARQKAEKEAKKAAKKAKFGTINAERNMAVVDVFIPEQIFYRDATDKKFYKKDVDADKEPWASYPARMKELSGHKGEVKLRVTRFYSNEEDTLRRLYGEDIVFNRRSV